MASRTKLKVRQEPQGDVVKTCAFCKRRYWNPCDEQRKEACQNFLFRSGKLKLPKTERVRITKRKTNRGR